MYLKLKRNKFTFFMAIVVVLLTTMSLGVAFISSTLSIIGNTTIKENSWIIYFDNVRKSSDSVASDKDAKIVDFKKTRIEFTANLKNPGDFYEFTVYTVNDGTIDAMVRSIERSVLTEEQQKYLEFDVTYDNGTPIRECDELNAGTRRRIKAIVKFKDGLDIANYPKEDVTLDLFFNINYVQKDDSCPPRVIKDQNVLTIVPNGGLYNKRSDEIRIYLDKGETYTVLTPERKLYNFTGWNVVKPESDGTYTFEDNVFTMGDEDVTIEANWQEGDYVARIMNKYYPTIQEAFDDAQAKKWKDNTVWLLRDTTEYPTNNTSDSFVFNLDGHTVTGTITNSNKGDITLVNGRIEAETDHQEAFINYGTLKLGLDDGDVQVENSIALIGNDIGLLNKPNSKFYFYDGYIEGVSGLIGGYTDKAKGYYVFVGHNGDRNCQRVYLTKNPNRAVVKTLTSGEMYYYNLQDAIKSIEFNKKTVPTLTDNDYIAYVIRDFEAAYTLDVAKDARIFINLDGNNVSSGEAFTNNGYLKIYNTNDTSSKFSTSVALTNNGTLDINEIKMVSTTENNVIENKNQLNIRESLIQGDRGSGIKNSDKGVITTDTNTVIKSNSGYGIYNVASNLVVNSGTIIGIYNEGTMAIDGNAIVHKPAGNLYGIHNKGTFTMNNGEVSVTGEEYLIYNENKFDFNNGAIISDKVALRNTGEFNANGGTITSSITAISNNGTLNIKGSEISSTTNSTISNSGTANVYSGDVVAHSGTGINGGTVNVLGGTVSGTTYGIDCAAFKITSGSVNSEDVGVRTTNYLGGGSAIVAGGTVMTKNTGIVTNSLQMTAGTVTSTENNGITVSSTGSITGGNVNGAIYGVHSQGELTLGTDDGEISNTSPTIIGGSYGLYIDGDTTNFYDGILKGQIDGYYGEINGTPLGSITSEGEETIDDNLYQTDFLINFDNWLRVGDQEFNNLNDASKYITSDGEIEVIRDVSITFKQQIIDEAKNKNITLNLNGHTVTTTQSIENDAHFTIKDTSEDKTGTLNFTKNDGIKNNNTLTIASGNYSSKTNTIVNNKGEVTIDGGKFNTDKTVVNNIGGTVTVNDGLIEQSHDALINTGTVYVKGGTIHATDNGILNSGRCIETVVDGGEINSDNAGIGGGACSVTVNDGNINAKDGYGIYVYDGNLYVNGGTITSLNNYGVDIHRDMIMNGGTIKGTTGIHNAIWCSWYTCYYGKVTVNDGLNIGTESNGIHLTVGYLFFNGGTAQGKVNGVLTDEGTTATLGNDDGTISTTQPLLIGDKYGLDTHGYLAFYDGILKGLDKAHNGLISIIPDATMIKDDYEFINRQEYKTQYLVEKGNWLRVGDQEFNSINKASAAIAEEGTMYVIADAYVDFDQELPANKKITFDLNGHTLTTTQPLRTAGDNKIVDSVGGGYIHNLRDDTIVASGTLKIEGGSFISDTDSALLSSANLTINGGHFESKKDYGIDISGTVVINDGEFTSDASYAINTSANLTINNCSIDSYGGINNIGTLIFNDGTITSQETTSINTSGPVTINNGTITNNSTSSGLIIGRDLTTINGGTITSTRADAIHLSSVNYSSGRLELNDGVIIGYKNGITNSNAANVIDIIGGQITGQTANGINSTCNTNLLGGVIKGETYGVYVGGGTTNIGEDDGNITIDAPILQGKLYGLYINNGTTNFSDGILKGATSAYYGVITNIPERAEIFEDNEIIDDVNYDVKYLVRETDIAINLQTNKIYSNLQDSLNEANEGETVQLLTNVPLYYELTNTNVNAFTLDLNGYTISTNKRILNQGRLTITNSNTKEANIKTSSSINLITNTNTLILDNINLKNTSSSNYVLYNNSDLEMNKVKIDSINGIQNNSRLNITNSEVKGSKVAINNNGQLSINGGIYTGDNYAIYSNTSRDVTITGATINGTYYNSGNNNSQVMTSTINGYLQNYGNALIVTSSTVNGSVLNHGTLTTNETNIISATGGTISNSGTMTMNDSLFKTSSANNYINYEFDGINNSQKLVLNHTNIMVDTETDYRLYVNAIKNSGTLEMNNNSQIKIGVYSKVSGTYTAIKNIGSGNVLINNSNIYVLGGGTGYGIYSSDSNATTTLVTGLIDVRGQSTTYGAYISLGTFTMGHYEGTGVESENVSVENPKIYSAGATRGIGIKKVNGFFNFYDGVIWASRYTKPETTSNVEYNYEVTTYLDEETGFEYAWLEYMKNDYLGSESVASINGTFYKTVQEAINKVEEGQEIKLLRATSEDLTIPEGKNVKLNLNGLSIATQIVNDGTLNVYNGSLQSFDNTTVINNGTFIMGEDDGKVSSTNIRVVSETTTINNKGTLIIYDGYIEGATPSVEGDINKIAEFARIYTKKDKQSERKYLQSLSEEAIKNKETDLILTIDPASGVYNNSKEKQDVYLKYQESYTLETPTKNGCIFMGWEISEENVLVGSVVTMNLSDVTVKATWMVSEDAVAKIGNEYYTSLNEAITAAKDGDTIELFKDVTEDVTNNKNITIDLGAKKVTGAFINEGILKILNGTIENPDGIGLVNKKTLTLGENDGDIEIDKIKIIGTTLGLQQDGRFNYYDGYIEGDIALNGSTNSVPKGYFLYNEHNNIKDCQRVYLIGNPQNAVAVIQEGGTQYFFSLQDAIDTASVTGSEIFIARDFEATYPITINEDANILINMSSYNITTGNNIVNNGNLKIYDTSETVGSITSAKSIENNGNLTIDKVDVITNTSNTAIINKGHLDLIGSTITAKAGYAVDTSGTFNMDQDSTLMNNAQALHNNQTEVLTLNGGTLSGITNSKTLVINNVTINNTNNQPGIYMDTANANTTMNGGTITTGNIGVKFNSNDQTFTMNDGTITATKHGIQSEQINNHIVINKGKIVSNEYGIFMSNNQAKLDIKDIDLTARLYGIYMSSYGATVNIEGGSIVSTNDTGYYDSYNNKTGKTTNITGGTIQGLNYGVYVYANDLTISNATIKNTVSNRGYYALVCQANATCTVNDGSKIISENGSAIYQRSEALNINGGEIYTGSSDGYGIYLSSGTLNVNGGVVSAPKLNAIGIVAQESNATMNINDGKITSGNIGLRLARNYSNYKTVNINGGTIQGDNYGIYQNIDESTINIGSSDSELSDRTPYITGGLYGIYNDHGDMNFYSGRLRGYTSGYKGHFSNVRTEKTVTSVSENDDTIGNILTYTTDNISSSPISNYAKTGDGYVRFTYLGETNDICTKGQEYNFDYTGREEIFNVPCAGNYKIEAWGAQGGGTDPAANGSSRAGAGGYATGTINLKLNEMLYINVGGQGIYGDGSGAHATGGYNGGGAGGYGKSGSGGGATHVATSSGLLSSLASNKNAVIIVAGGGGGADDAYGTYNGSDDGRGGSGGGYIGGAAYINGKIVNKDRYPALVQNNGGSGMGGTQDKGFAFGQGESVTYNTDTGGAGGGWYGGYVTNNNGGGAGGGSGYTGNKRLSDTVMYGYNVSPTITTWINNYLIDKEDFLQVGDKTFNSLNKAQAAIEENGTGIIVVLKDAEMNESSIIETNKNVTLDLNGKTLIMTKRIINQANLTVVDSSIDKTGMINSVIDDTFQNESSLTLEGVNIKSELSNVYTPANITGSTVTVRDCKLDGAGGLYSVSPSTLTVENTSIKATVDGIKLDNSNSILTMTDSSIISENRGVYLENAHSTTIDMTNTTIEATNQGILITSQLNTINLTDTNISSKNNYAIQGNYGNNNLTNLTINGGTFDGQNTINTYGIRLNMSGSEINSKASGRNNYAVRCESYSSCEISDTIITAPNASGIWMTNNLTLTNVEISASVSNAYGIAMNGSTLTLNGATKITTPGNQAVGIFANNSYKTVLNMNNAEINSGYIGIHYGNSNNQEKIINIANGKVIGTKYGILQENANGIVTIGTTNSELTNNNPYISGGEYGIYKTDGQVNFYNGRLRGKMYGYNDEFNGIRKGKDIYAEYEIGDTSLPTTLSTLSLSSNPISKQGKLGNGYARLTYIGEATDSCNSNQVYNFDYIGSEDTFDTPCAGQYKVEVWGAQGGGPEGGAGSYSTGTIELNEGEKLYINVGSQGGETEGGYNGGGTGGANNGQMAYAGGGATHIATSSGLLSELSEAKESVIIVAGGGGGSGSNVGAFGGAAGGYIGNDGYDVGNHSFKAYNGTGATQTAGGRSYNGGANCGVGTFGSGGNFCNNGYGGAGGGGGWYGGGGSNRGHGGAGGGTGYISNSRLTDGMMYGYKITSNGYINNYLVEKDAFLQVGDKLYNSLNDAILDITDIGTVNVINDGSLQEISEIPEGKNITLNLNGHKLTTTREINNYGDLNIIDNTATKKGAIDTVKGNAIVNHHNLTIDGIKIDAEKTVIYGSDSTGTITLKNGASLTGTNGIYLDYGQTIEYLDAKINATDIGIRLQADNSTFNMSKGTIIGTNKGIYTYGESNNITVNGGSIISTNGIGIHDDRAKNIARFSKITVNGGTIIGTTHGVYIYYSVGTFNGGEISTRSGSRDEYALYCNNYATCTLGEGLIINAPLASGFYQNAEATISGATINVDGPNSYGVYNESGNLTINNGTTINASGYASYGLFLDRYQTTVNFENSTIESGNVGVYLGGKIRYNKTLNIKSGRIVGKNYGIHQTYSGVTTNVGSLEDEVSTTNPYIEGGLYSIYETDGAMNFYSGLLKGFNKVYYGSFNNIRTGYEIFEDYTEVQTYLRQQRTISTTEVNENAIAGSAKRGNGYAKITYVENTASDDTINPEIVSEVSCTDLVNKVYEFDSIGAAQTFTSVCSGKYKLEVWGAQGGYRSAATNGGKGGYTSGEIRLNNNDKLYVYVGGSGNSGGYNGGGTRTIGHGGGGATDIRLNDSLYSRIIVAGGGGSDGATNKPGGAAGGLSGQTRSESYGSGGVGGTQSIAGNERGSFGLGGAGLTSGGGYGGAGGGGWYGGGGVSPDGSGDDDRGGGGGSGFAYTNKSIVPSKYTVDSRFQLENVQMYSGLETMPDYKDINSATIGNSDEGHARITFIEPLENDSTTFTINLESPLGVLTTKTLTYQKGAKLGVIEAPTVSDSKFEFEGWYLDEEYTRKVTSETVVNSSFTLHAKFKYNNASCNALLNTEYNFDYTGDAQVFNVYCPGKYKVEVWGASGGNATYETNSYIGGYGGYTTGDVILKSNEKLSIYVGGKGGSVTYKPSESIKEFDSSTGYNGGGYATIYPNNSAHGGGGGATSIFTKYGNGRSTVLMVAGGGGGASAHYQAPNYSGNGGSGGGAIGGSGETASTTCYNYGTGGTQNTPGTFTACTTDGRTNRSGILPTISASMYRGANYTENLEDSVYAGGGGGYYGGEAGWHGPGGGGSGYNANSRVSNNFMYGYNLTEQFNSENTNIAYLTEAKNFVTNTTQNKDYANLQTALDETHDGDILRLNENYAISYNIDYDSNNKVIFDLNGYNLSITKPITNSGHLTIKNTNESQISKLYSTVNMNLLTNNGTLKLENISIEAANTTVINNSQLEIVNTNINSPIGINNSTGGTINMSNSSIVSSNQALVNYGVLTLDSSTISGTNYGIYYYTTATSTISNTTITSGTNAIYSYNTGVLNLNNCSITGNIETSNSKGTLNIVEGNIVGYIRNIGKSTIRGAKLERTINDWYDDNLINNSGDLTLENNEIIVTDIYTGNSNNDTRAIYNRGTLSSSENIIKVNHNGDATKYMMGIENISILESTSDIIELSNGKRNYGIYNNTDHDSTISNITVKSFNSTEYDYGIYNNKGTLTVDHGTINMYDSNESNGVYVNTVDAITTSKDVNINIHDVNKAYGVYVNEGSLTIETGTINASATVQSTGINITSGTVNLGILDGSGTDSADVSVTNPLIQAIAPTGVGISMGNGTFNYYDGKIVGSTSARTEGDIVSATEKNYQAITLTDDATTYQYCILEFIK